MRSRFLKAALLFTCFTAGVQLRAQKIIPAGREFNFETYTVEDGLIQSNISGIFQDSRGYLWAGTVVGVSRFDGSSFTNFTSKDGIKGLATYGICEDDSGNVWFGSNKGVSWYDGMHIHSFDSASGMPRWQVWCLYHDKDGTIWAGTMKGVFHFDPRKKQKPLLEYFLPGENLDNSIRCFLRTSKDSLLIGTENGIFVMVNGKAQKCADALSIHCITELKDGKLLAGGWMDNMYVFDNRKIVKAITLNTPVLNMARDKSGNIWLATWQKGIIRLEDGDENKDLTAFTVKEGLPANSYWTIYCDRENNLWFGSWGAGLVKYSGSRFSYVDERYGLLNNAIISIIPGNDSSIWFSSEVGVSRYDPFAQSENNFTNYDNCKGKKLEKVMGIAIDKSGTVWLPGYSGTGYKIEKEKITALPWLTSFCIISDHLGRIWRGGDNTGVKLFDPREHYRDQPTEKQFLVKEKAMNRILYLYEDSRGNVWALNDQRGVNVVTGDTALHFDKKDGFGNDAVQAITEDDKGRLWMGLRENGLLLCKYNDDHSISILDSVTARDGLSSPSIGCLIFDKQGDLVIGTLNGMSVLHMKEYASGKKIISSYARSEGFKAGECNQGIAMDKLGRIWISSAKGAWCYDPSAEKENDLAPVTHITGADLFFEPTDWKQYGNSFDRFNGLPNDLELSYNKNHITFHFSGISLTAPSKVKYQYMMAGVDRDWSPADNRREVTYPNLPPGNYTFLVKACNNNGTWNTDPVSFHFSILPPFWQRTWFYLFVALVLVAGAWYYVRWRERKLKLEKSLLEEKVKERTVELRVAYGQIEEKNKDITDSINYAKRIQQSILPTEESMHKLLPGAFVLYLPKDIVSGDFYWVEEQDGKIIFAVVDCTGHGVPGALMSMVGNAALNEIVLEGHVTQPDKILSLMREKVIRVLRQKGHEAQTRDGFDIALCAWDGKNTLQFCGANNPMLLVREGKLQKIAGDKQPVGTHEGEAKDFTLHSVTVQKGDQLYIMSDGYADQFGGPKGKKFKQVQLQQLLHRIHHLPLHEQKKQLERSFESWRGNLSQVDDVCIIGVRF